MLSIKVPPLGESIVEATVSRWLKKEGDVVAAGDTVVELDTDKITVEVPALKPGVLAKQAKKEGDVVHVDDVLGEIDEAAVPASTGAGAQAAAPAAAPAPAVSPRPSRHQQLRQSRTSPRRARPRRGASPMTAGSTSRLSPALGVAEWSPSLTSWRRRQDSRAFWLHARRRTGSRRAEASARRRKDVHAAEADRRKSPSVAARDGASHDVQRSRHVRGQRASREVQGKGREGARREADVHAVLREAACMALEQFPMVNAQIDGDAIIYKHTSTWASPSRPSRRARGAERQGRDRKGMLDISRDITPSPSARAMES